MCFRMELYIFKDLRIFQEREGVKRPKLETSVFVIFEYPECPFLSHPPFPFSFIYYLLFSRQELSSFYSFHEEFVLL